MAAAIRPTRRVRDVDRPEISAPGEPPARVELIPDAILWILLAARGVGPACSQPSQTVSQVSMLSQQSFFPVRRATHPRWLMSDEQADLREAYVDELIDLARREPRLVVLDADASRTSRSRRFRDTYPDRRYNMGVAEQDMLGVAAGMAAAGLMPVTITFAVFTTMRACERGLARPSVPPTWRDAGCRAAQRSGRPPCRPACGPGWSAPRGRKGPPR